MVHEYSTLKGYARPSVSGDPAAAVHWLLKPTEVSYRMMPVAFLGRVAPTLEVLATTGADGYSRSGRPIEVIEEARRGK